MSVLLDVVPGAAPAEAGSEDGRRMRVLANSTPAGPRGQYEVLRLRETEKEGEAHRWCAAKDPGLREGGCVSSARLEDGELDGCSLLSLRK